MEVTKRMDVMKESGRLSAENYSSVMKVLDYLELRQGIRVTEENGGMFVGHLCEALERISAGEDIEPLDPHAYEETTQEPNFERAVAICRDLRYLLPQITPGEAEWIVVHVGVMLGNMRLRLNRAYG